MKKGQSYEGTVVSVDYPDRGTVDCGDDGKALVKGVIPGQKIRFRVTKAREGKSAGRLLEVITPSPIENVTPACPHFGLCGGCAYQTVSRDNQLVLKENMVRCLLDGAVSRPYAWEGIFTGGSPYEYRNKMEFSFGDEVKGGPLALGMHRKDSFYDIVTASGCKIVDNDFRRILKCVLDYFTELKLPFYHRVSHQGFLRHLVIRKGARTGEILVCIVTTSDESAAAAADFDELVKALQDLPLSGRISGILHMVFDGVADTVKSDRTDILYGRDYIYEEILGLRFKISPFSFFQTNTDGAETLYEKVRSFAGDVSGRVIFDLYSGTGTIAQILAPVAKKTVGVEIAGEAVKAARENARQNGLENCEFIEGDVLKVLDNLSESPDIIILDPPRDGVNPKALGKITGYGAGRIIYISCKPTSLARDIVIFEEAGYRVGKACAVDMFPQTRNVETVVLMSKI